MSDLLDSLAEAGALSPLDVQLARSLGAISREDRLEVLLGAAAASRQTREGHVCADLPALAGHPILDGDGQPVASARWPSLVRWQRALQDSPLVGSGHPPTPLVLSRGLQLYLRRYWEHEQVLASRLAMRAGSADPHIDEALLAEGLERIMSPPPRPGRPDQQRIAAANAVLRKLCVITGGPGTGKTSTVVRILALLLEQARAADRRLHIRLLAPTGKAAARLGEAIRVARDRLPCDPAIRDAIPDEASTIHRALRPLPSSPTRFRHDAEAPLPDDVIVVDEASMVDLALMRRLVDAVPPRARLVLLGDRDQLTSVEAGAVLGDLCGDTTHTAASPGWRARLVPFVPVPPPVAEEDAPPIRDALVHLDHSFRFREDSGIQDLARAIRAGDAETTVRTLDRPDRPDVRRHPRPEPGTLGPELEAAIRAGYGDAVNIREPSAALTALEHFRLLCAHREGPWGVTWLNQLVERELEVAGALRTTGRWYPGRPILITRNDYRLGLYNGDIGVLLPEPRSGALRAWFWTADRNVRGLSPARLPPHETVFAMSVHKSQGSEFDRVAVVLPERGSPLLTRELLYTAVTRARSDVTVIGDADAIRASVETRIQRASRLREALWTPTGA